MSALSDADVYLSDQAGRRAFSGSVPIGVNGKTVFEKGYGLADAEWKIPNTPSTKFRIASLTKQFTAASILLLQERGQLKVQDRISKYVPDLPPTWQAVTLHQLLTHTSGIPNYPEIPQVQKVLNRTGATPRELIGVAATKPLEFKPGTQLHYTNTGYILLGLVIEKVSGMSYGEFLRKNIFGPLEMANSGYDDQAAVLSERASGYMLKNGLLSNADFIDMSIPFAAGSIYSTVEDMFRWNEALADGHLLSTASKREMFAVYPETLFEGQHYGYGVVVASRFDRVLFYHGGGVSGFESVVQRYPNEHLCIVVLENLDPSAPWNDADQIASQLFGNAR